MQPNQRRGASETGTVPTARMHHKEQMLVRVCATVAVSLAGPPGWGTPVRPRTTAHDEALCKRRQGGPTGHWRRLCGPARSGGVTLSTSRVKAPSRSGQ